jgi:hypothetical protein
MRPEAAKCSTSVLSKALASVAAVALIAVAVATQTDLFGGSDEPTATTQTTAEVLPVTPAPAPVLETTPAPVEDVETAAAAPAEEEVVAPAEPEVTLPFEVAETPAAAEPQAVAEVDPETGLLAPTWTVTLPFGMRFDPGRERVLSVNGIPVETRAEFDTAIQETVEPGDATTVGLSIEVGSVDGDSAVQNVDVPVVHRSGFANGLQFETRHDGTVWKTKVSALPTNNTLEISVDDEILAFLNTNELVDGIDTLRTLLERELATDAGTLMFAVQRGGENWAVAVPTEALLAGAGG